MDDLTAGRVVALLTGTVTFAFLFAGGSWHTDNLFLVPDLIVCSLLAGAALVPGPRAAPMLALALSVTAGVFICATAGHVQLRESWTVTLVGTAATLGTAAYLLAGENRRAERNRAAANGVAPR